ncbi:MAG TPA: hypothetical protein VJP59_00230 [Gemmatimonadota bacterium]|nr:hypothetical protein [Gemmatimonadota bacterium]
MASRLASRAVAVQTTATLLLSASRHRSSVLIANAGPNAIYIGASGVTTATGFPIAAGASRDFPNSTIPEDLYAIAATANQSSPADTRVWEVFDE